MAESPKKAATLQDVAHVANVSYQTVSRVVNNNPNVAEETRNRVLQAIEQLNYRPNRADRSLIMGHLQTLQVISFNANYTQPVRFFINAAKELNFHIGISTLNNPTDQAELRLLLDELTSRMVDRFVLFEPPFKLNKIDIDQLYRGTPFVQVGAFPCPNIRRLSLTNVMAWNRS